MQTLCPSHWHLLNPQPSTVLDCGHIVILFWCAEGQRAASVIREGLAPNTARRVLRLPRRLSSRTSWIIWARSDIFIWRINGALEPRRSRTHWPSLKFAALSSAFINRFYAPFTHSEVAVRKSVLCHVHLKYFMFLRRQSLPLNLWGFSLAMGERKYLTKAAKHFYKTNIIAELNLMSPTTD